MNAEKNQIYQVSFLKSKMLLFLSQYVDLTGKIKAFAKTVYS